MINMTLYCWANIHLILSNRVYYRMITFRLNYLYYALGGEITILTVLIDKIEQ